MAIPKKRKSNRTCSVLNCNSKCSRRVSVFLFPKNEKLKQEWANVLKLGKPVTPYMYVCSLHFRKDDIMTFPGITSSRRRLKQGAIPSQRLPVSHISPVNIERLKQASNCLEMEMKIPNMLSSDDNALECRACLQKFDYDAGLLNLFQAWDPPWNGMGKSIAEDFAALASVQISMADQYSKLICPMCHLKLIEACTFVANVRLNDRIMREGADLETTFTYPQRNCIQEERNCVQEERNGIQEERNYIQEERNYIQEERNYIQEEKNYIQGEKNYMQEEKNYMQEEKNYIQEEKNYIQEEKNYIQEQKSHTQKETIWPKPIQVDKDVNTTILENSMAVEVKQEVASEDECDMNDSENVYKELDYNNLEIKTEPEDTMEPTKIQIIVNGTITMDQFAQNSLSNGDINSEEQCFAELPKVKEEPMSEDEDVEMSPDLPLECLLCTKNFNSVSGLKAHVISQHSYETVERKPHGALSPEKKHSYVCATCRSSFATPTDLMVHETRHNQYACYLCNAKYDTFERLTQHRKRCKAFSPHVIQKPKTLEDVKRHPVSSLNSNETTDWLSSESADGLQDDTGSASNVAVRLKIKSISENSNGIKTVNGGTDIEMKTDPLASNVSEE